MPAGAAAFTALCAEDLRDGADVVGEAWRMALFCALGGVGGAGPPSCSEFLDGTTVGGGVNDVQTFRGEGTFAHGGCLRGGLLAIGSDASVEAHDASEAAGGVIIVVA